MTIVGYIFGAFLGCAIPALIYIHYVRRWS